MDFDLFECDEDDDILGSVLLEPTQQQSEPLAGITTENLPEFQCSGEDTNNTAFAAESFVKTKFLSHFETINKLASHISLTPYRFGAKEICARSVTQYLFADAFINVQHLVAGIQGAQLGYVPVTADLNFYQRRQQITQLLHLVLFTLKPAQWTIFRQYLAKLRNLLNSISTKEILKLIYFANSCKGNECNLPTYHLLHGLLEWQFLDLCILYKFEGKNSSASNKNTFREQLDNTIDNLLVCSLLFYGKKRSAELLFASPFPCTCVKELWLLLQLMIHQWGSTFEQFHFWQLFNEAMSRVKLKAEQFSISPLGYYEFAVWMLQAQVKLHGYRSNGQYEGPNYKRENSELAENYGFVEQCTQQFINANPTEEQLRVHICLITPILLDWWRPRATISMLLWEYFHKRLNSAFYVSGSAPNNLAVTCGSGRAYLERYRTLLEKFNNPIDANLCSYTLFTLMLGKSLEQLCTTPACGNQSQKLLGRIYSKFSLQKFLALNDIGTHHLVELFLILALCGDFKDIFPKLREKLLAIAFEKVPNKRQITVIKGHMALLILCAEQRYDITDYVSKLLQQLGSIRNDIAVSKVIADGLLDIVQYYDKNCPLGEHLLIDAWLPSFLQLCTPVEQERTLEALHLIFEKLEANNAATTNFMINTKSNSQDMIQALQTHVLPFVKQQYTSSFSDHLPQLAADFCLNADTNHSKKLLTFFVEAQTASRQALPQFLLKILSASDNCSNLVDDAILMHVWLKSLVLLTAQHAIVVQLTKNVIQLPVFTDLTNLTPFEISQAKEPLCVFVAAVGKSYDAATFHRRCEIADQFNSYVRNFDKWICSNSTETKLDQQLEVSFRFYSFIAIVIYNCPNIVYAKSKTNCFFHIAITRFILPPSIQMGKPPEGKLAHLVHKIWPVLVQGIGRLNFKTDAYIQKTLNDLIQKWTPLFKPIAKNSKIVARPFSTCLLNDNQELSLHICERLTSLFLATQRRQADPNACLVISIFQEILTAITQDPSSKHNVQLTETRLETFMKGTLLLTLEHIMMVDEIVPSRGMLLELFRRLLCCSAFQNSNKLQQLFLEYLRVITKKHLAYYTFFYFDLLTKLAQISHELISNFLKFLYDEICVVEQKRGAGEDNRIRSCFQQLKQCIDNETKKLINKK